MPRVHGRMKRRSTKLREAASLGTAREETLCSRLAAFYAIPAVKFLMRVLVHLFVTFLYLVLVFHKFEDPSELDSWKANSSLPWNEKLPLLSDAHWSETLWIICEFGLWLDKRHLIDGLELGNWKPWASWAVGLHGSRGNSNHIQWADNVQIASGSLRSYAEVPVKLSRNGQQFDAAGAHTYGYRAPPVVSSVRPSAGAAWDNTTIILRGRNFAGGSRVRAGNNLQCPSCESCKRSSRRWRPTSRTIPKIARAPPATCSVSQRL